MPKKERLLEFKRNWLCNSLKDSELYPYLKVFLEPLYHPKHELWTWEKCRFMVTHGLRHILNVFRYATRLYYDVVHNPDNPYRNENFLKDDVDKVCLIVSIWLHDWGMAGPEEPPYLARAGFPPEKRNEKFLKILNESLETASKKLGEKFTRLEKRIFPCSWVRPNHSLISFYNITRAPETLGLHILERKLKNYGRDLEDVSVTCLFHRFPLNKLREFGKGYLSGLCGLLAFLDGCDENWQRLISIEHVNELISRGIKKGDEVYETIDSMIDSRELERYLRSIGIDEREIMVLRETWGKGEFDEVLELINVFLKICESKDKEKLLELKRDIEYYKKGFVEQFEKHIDLKSLIDEVFFKNGEIILLPRHEVSEENPGIKETLNKIRSHLDDYSEGLEKIGLHYTKDSIRLWRPEDGDRDKLEIPEIGPFSPIEEKIKENTDLGRFPAEEHFRKRLVYFDKKESEEIEKILGSKSGRCYLLYGPPSLRKTTFSLSFGLYLRQKGYSVFYREVEEGEEWEENWKELVERITPYDEEKVLFITDECHNSPETIGKFINEVKTRTNKAKFLFVSRKISKGRFKNQDNNYFDKLESRRAWKDLKRAFKGVIKRFRILNEIDEDQIGDIDKVMETCGHKFSILNYLLEKVWNPSKEILSEIPRERIYEKVVDDFLKTDPRTEILTKLSVIYQFEGTPIPPEGINALGVDAQSSAFEELRSEGAIYRKISKVTGRMYFTVCDDSTFVKLILETVDHTGWLRLIFPQFKSMNEFTLETLKNYLCEVKRHTTLLLSSIYDSGEQEIGEQLIQDENVVSAFGDYLRLLKNPTMIANLLALLRKFKVKESDKEVLLCKGTLEQWTKNLATYNPISFFFLLRELGLFNENKKLDFLKIINVKEAAKIYKEGISKGTLNISSLDGLIAYSNKVFSNKILNQLTGEEIKKIFSNSELSQLHGFFEQVKMSELPDHFKRAWNEFLNEKDEAELLRSLLEEDLVKIGRFVRTTYWHLKMQPIYNRVFFTNLQFLNKLKKANLEETAQFISEISAIKFKGNPSIGANLGSALLTLDYKLIEQIMMDTIWQIRMDTLDYELIKPIMMDFGALKAARKAGKLITEGRVTQIDPLKFSVVGYHGEYTVSIENDIIKCTCPGYAKRVFCSHSIAALKKYWETQLEKKIKKSSLSGIQRMLRIADELEMKDLTARIISIIEEPLFNLAKKLSDSDSGDLAYFLWNVSYDQSLYFKYHKLIIENVNLVDKLKNAKIEVQVFLLWNLFEGISVPTAIFDEKTLLDLLKEEGSLKEGKIGEKLALIGLFDSISPDLLERIDFSNVKTYISDSEDEIKRWFWGRHGQRGRLMRKHFMRGLFSLFLFILGIRGFRRINEERCFSFLVAADFDIERLIHQLRRNYETLKEKGRMKEKREKLYKEILEWLSSQSEISLKIKKEEDFNPAKIFPSPSGRNSARMDVAKFSRLTLSCNL